MKRVKYLVLGAGPSGLAFCHRLLELGEDSFLILEKETIAGGLCRSENVDGAPLDIGGGHFLDVKRKKVLNMLFKFLPEQEWNYFERDSKIFYRGSYMDYPFESNLWQLNIEEQIGFIQSVANAGCVQGLPMPNDFEEWISWKLGEKIAKEYMLPYNRKIWSIDLNELGTYWLHKLPDVSFSEILESCLKKGHAGKIPAHGQFYYPKNYGYGEVWKRMGLALKDKIRLDCKVSKVDITNLIVNDAFQAKTIINTIPWKFFVNSLGLDIEVKKCIENLKYNSIDIQYDQNSLSTNAQWIYLPDESIPYHRILCRHNFVDNSKGIWYETNSKRNHSKDSLWEHHNEYAYPLNTQNKQDEMELILDWGQSKNIYGLGRWGTWNHMNSDVCVEAGIDLADELTKIVK